MITPNQPYDELIHLPAGQVPAGAHRSSAVGAPLQVEAPQSPVAMVTDRLRGRWRLAILLGILLGALFSAAGYVFAPAYYESTAVVHVASTGTPIMRDTAWSDRLPNYRGEILMHQFWMTHPLVIAKVQQDEEVAKLIAQSDGSLEIGGNLAIDAPFGSELIYLTFQSKNSGQEAETVVNAVLDAYYERYGRGVASERELTQRELQGKRDRYAQQRMRIKKQISDFVNGREIPTSDLDSLVEVKAMRLEELKAKKQEIENQIAARQQREDDILPLEFELSGPTDAEVLAIVPELGMYRTRRADFYIELMLLSRRYKPDSPQIVAARERLNVLDIEIGRLIERAEQTWRATPRSRLPSPERPLTLTDLRAEKQNLEQSIERARQEMRALSDQKMELDELQGELQVAEERYQEHERLLSIMRLNTDTGQLAGQVTIMQRGEAPPGRSNDKRKAGAAAGFVAGMGLSFGLFFLLGTLDRRAYSASQLRQLPSGVKVLGVLPDLRSRRIDVELSETATQCVHQIRNRIEALRNPGPSFVLLVTSPFQGDGKTSLAMALGWSYAAAGHRTVLVDCDFFGMSLTRQMGAAGIDGVKEVLRQRQLRSEVLDMPVRNLSVLGAGRDETFGPESIRRDDFATMCAELRQQFEIIILDSGPSIGSIELLPVAAASDGVVFSMHRGRPRTRLDECLADLNTVQAKCLGVILNCADQSDCKRYVSRSTVSAREPIIPNGTRRAQRANELVKAMGRAKTDGQ